MPLKKKGKKSGKKKGKKSPTKDRDSRSGSADSITPEVNLPPLPHGYNLVKLLSTHEVEEKEVHGMKVTTKILEHLTPQEIRDLRFVFETFDTNCDGMITHVELRRCLKSIGFKISKEVARDVTHDNSIKTKGMVDFNEFMEIVIDQQGDTRDAHDEIVKGFKLFDIDKSGRITLENLKQACRDARVKFTTDDLQEMIQEADLNGDGVIDKEEFVKIMLKTNLF